MRESKTAVMGLSRIGIGLFFPVAITTVYCTLNTGTSVFDARNLHVLELPVLFAVPFLVEVGTRIDGGTVLEQSRLQMPRHTRFVRGVPIMGRGARWVALTILVSTGNREIRIFMLASIVALLRGVRLGIIQPTGTPIDVTTSAFSCCVFFPTNRV